jgi:hypothetical protein
LSADSAYFIEYTLGPTQEKQAVMATKTAAQIQRLMVPTLPPSVPLRILGLKPSDLGRLRDHKKKTDWKDAAQFMQSADEISTKTLMPVFNVSGCVGHILKTARGFRACDANDKKIGVFETPAAGIIAGR